MMGFFLCTFVAYTFINAMKYYKQTLYILCGLLLTTVGLLVYSLYLSGVENQRKDKMTAEMLLKDAATAWVSQELEQQRVPFYSAGGSSEEKISKRRIVTATGTLIVEIDSVKEIKRLLSSDFLASMARYLLMSGVSSIDGLNEQWQKKLNASLPHYYSAFEFIPQMPNNGENLKRTLAGNPTLCLPENKLRDYYLDNMYFLEVKAYLSVPSVWWCADWRRMDLVLYVGGLILGICILVFLLIYNRNRVPNDKVDVLSPDVLVQHDEFLLSDAILSADTIVSDDEIVCSLGNAKYQLREILFDEKEMAITYKGQVKQCSKQPYKLLSAFIHAKDHFLSDGRIAEICDWNLDDIGLEGKRKTAMSKLRGLLESDNSRVNIVRMRNEKDEVGFVLLLTK